MDTLNCQPQLTLKRKSEDIPAFEEKRSRLEPSSPKPEPPVEFESINNNYKTIDDELPECKAECEEVVDESFGSDSEAVEERTSEVAEGSAENMAAMRDEMFQKYQPWVLEAHGDLRKTKTITMKKYDRIVRTLKGLIPNMAENSKFRFWIRTKGFCLGPPDPKGQQDLFVACLRGNGETVYKHVAVVEKFFDIIYSIHVELEGRGGRHAGQKKTYRAISERYAFLPREAVTRFLLGCVECQRRSDVDLSSSDKTKTPSRPKHETPLTNPDSQSDTKTSSPKDACDQTVPSSNSSANPGSEASLPRPRNPDTLHDFSCDSKSSYTQELTSKFESESPLMSNFRHSSDESRSTSSGHETLEQSKTESAIDPFNETPKSIPVPMNLSMIRRRIPYNLHNLEAKYDVNSSVIKKSGFPGFSPDRSNLEHTLRLSTSTPDSNRSKSISGSDTTISKSTDSSGVEISPIEPEHFQKPYPKKLYTIHPTTFETIRIPLKHTEISIYYEKNRPYIKPKKRVDSDSPLDDPDAPILSTYLKYMRSLGYSDEESLKLDSDAEIRSTPEPDLADDHYQGRNGELRLESPGEDAGIWQYHNALGTKKPTPPTPRDIPSPATLQETGSVHDETSSSGNKEDEDDDEEEIDDLKTIPHDPERLKAFNMFVRLFVDENLDRIVPISKQPKEKIQAIIDSCTRQFPEFAERARKRIRTYLKSCRRNKRTRDTAWPESNRPTPAHLTSVQAEQILAQACENESHNAKRMRLGLDPVSQPMPVIPGSETPPSRPAHESFSAASLASSAANSDSKTQHPLHLNNNKPDSPNLAKASEPPSAPTISSVSSSGMNGAAASTAPTPLYRPNFSQAFQRAAATAPQPPFPPTHLFPTPPFGPPGIMHNGPTDLSMKPSKPLLSHKLNPTEMAAVRQLITGYRESAAFLLRSAEELEQLLLQQP